MSTVFQNAAFPPSLSALGPTSNIPSGTFAPGTKVQVGLHRVIIEKYLSEGGFAHVYVVRLPKPVDGAEMAVLKRVAVPDKETLANMRTEVDTMKKLKGRRHIVTYIDSHASQLKGGGYEVFLLMEYCNGGGLIDFMNTRLQNRLTEPEVLKIFSDVAQGVACMHYLKPPLLHRDLKVENVLMAKSGSSRLYKLCDFGSTAPPRPAATNAAEGRLIEEDVQKHTTLQYRSPEMIDVYRNQPIDEKSDIWALGVLLYKLCYYKTPFEDQGQTAILNASFKYPGYPAFSDGLKSLIVSMLREKPQLRPNIYQVVHEVARIRGTDTPIKDIYAERTQSESRRNQHLPSPDLDIASPPAIGAVHAPPSAEKETIPDITPMRRGRPIKAVGGVAGSKPSRSPLRPAAGDPFTALDSKPALVTDPILDDISARFPALDDFSLLHEKGNRFSFDGKTEELTQSKPDISQRVTNALADEAFARPKTSATPQVDQAKPNIQTSISKTSPQRLPGKEGNPVPDSRQISLEQRVSQKSGMISTGTMTSPPPSPPLEPKPMPKHPAFRVPAPSSIHRSSSQPRISDNSDHQSNPPYLRVTSRPGLLDHRSKSQILVNTSKPSRTSSDASHRSSYLSGSDESVHRSKSANFKSRPSSLQASKPNMLRKLSRERPSGEKSSHEAAMTTIELTDGGEIAEGATAIDSNVEFLKRMEEEDTSKRREKRISGGSRHSKRSSMPSVYLSGTKQMLAGRFGEAFRKFETNSGSERRDPSHSPSRGPNDLTPIAGSEATDGRSDDGIVIEETEDVPPEIRRELERRRLSQEERRVADAAAAYRLRLAQGIDGRPGPSSKAASIQSKVKSLLDESGRASPSPTKTPEGYGRFTNQQPSPNPRPQPTASEFPLRTSSRRPATNSLSNTPDPPFPQKVASKPENRSVKQPSFIPPRLPNTMSAPPISDISSSREEPSLEVRAQRPTGPPKPQPKPQALRTGDKPPQSPAKPASLAVRKMLPIQVQQSRQNAPPTTNAFDGQVDDDWETNFSKRYPDLSGLEMVETEIDHRDTGGASLKMSQLGREVRDV